MTKSFSFGRLYSKKSHLIENNLQQMKFISSIGVGLVPMTSQAKMAALRWPPGLQDGRHDL